MCSSNNQEYYKWYHEQPHVIEYYKRAEQEKLIRENRSCDSTQNKPYTMDEDFVPEQTAMSEKPRKVTDAQREAMNDAIYRWWDSDDLVGIQTLVDELCRIIESTGEPAAK
jgi:hypothetical protein